jgi:co-chaperonin GroES (HSP10)
MTINDQQLPADLDPYLRTAIEVAFAENGVTEDPKMGQNRGARVDEYIKSTHLDPAANPPTGYPWCACFVYWCFKQAAEALGQSNPCTRTASVVTHWDFTSARKILAADARLDHSKVRPGMIFCKTHDRHSHTGIVCAVKEEGIVTVEGNTNRAGSREGDTVVFGKLRPWDYVQCGFIDYVGMSVLLGAVVAGAVSEEPDVPALASCDPEQESCVPDAEDKTS